MLENPVFESENSSPDGLQLTRRNLLALGAAAGIALSLPALPARAVDFTYSDAKAIRFLLEVAQLEYDFFARASVSGTAEALDERESNALAWIAKQDAELVRWCNAAFDRTNMGAASTFFTPNTSTSRPIPTYRFGLKSFEDRASLFASAISIKQIAVGAFHGVVGEAKAPDMIQAFASLAGVQGRHLGVLEELAGQNPFVVTESSLSRNEVAAQLEGYGFNREVLV
ncbi:hypothetical protein EON80_22855 [bacterium]|nr:MAG: hypothetical protein EON80_22855 [bacterium]